MVDAKKSVSGRWLEKKVDYISASLKFAWIHYCKRNTKILITAYGYYDKLNITKGLKIANQVSNMNKS